PLYHDLGRLQRTVQHSVRISMIQGDANLAADVQQVPDRETFLPGNHVAEAVAFDVLHGGTELAFDFPRAIKKRDVLAVEHFRVLGFLQNQLNQDSGKIGRQVEANSL